MQIWNKVGFWPLNLSTWEKLFPYKCRHCDVRFAKRTELGGHARKMHKGMSDKYAVKMQIRNQRTGQRTIHTIAKGICTEMRQGVLDELTLKNFRFIQKIMNAAEWERKVLNDLGDETNVKIPEGQHMTVEAEKRRVREQIMRAEKERVRRMIVKVKRVLAKPSAERQQLIGPKWLALLDTISPDPVTI